MKRFRTRYRLIHRSDGFFQVESWQWWWPIWTAYPSSISSTEQNTVDWLTRWTEPKPTRTVVRYFN